MLLAMDVGNTQTVLGLFDGEVLRAMWRISSDRSRTPDELALVVRELLATRGWRPEEVRQAVVGSVVPPLTAAARGMAELLLDHPPLVVDHTLRLDVELAVEEPALLGADRIANAVAAYRQHGAPVIVVDLGTATTYDVLASGGRYLGGVIAPGLFTAAEELVRRTSRLPRVDLVPPASVIGRNTEEAMRAGLVLGAAVQIDGLVRRIWRELGERCPVIATGGDAGILMPLCETVDLVEPHLTLIGLRLIHELNREG